MYSFPPWAYSKTNIYTYKIFCATIISEVVHMYSKILRSLRIDNGLTQQQLAEILEFKSSSAIGMLEREERELSIETIIRAANYFNVSTDYLLGLVPFKNETEAKVFMKAKPLLDLEDAEHALKFILSRTP